MPSQVKRQKLSISRKVITALSYTKKPIEIVPGRGRYTPELFFSYNSTNATDRDISGYGWTIGEFFKIERINKNGSHTIFPDDVFHSSIDGELVQVGSSNIYRPKVETGKFLTYERLASGWQVTDKEGTQFLLGTSVTGRAFNIENSSEISQWWIEHVEDLNGNITSYSYFQDQGMVYPDTIQYTDHSSQAGIYKVRFIRELTDEIIFCNQGFCARKKYRIASIETSEREDLIRIYTLRYEKGSNGRRDLLAGITESGYAGAEVITLPEETYTYSGREQLLWTNDEETIFPEPLGSKGNGVQFGDIDGNGLQDMVRYYLRVDAEDGNTTIESIRRIHLNLGNGNWQHDIPWNWGNIRVPFTFAEKGYTSNSNRYHDLGSRLIDIDGDGDSDFIAAWGCRPKCKHLPEVFPASQIGVYINNGAGFEYDPNWAGLDSFTRWHDLIDDVDNQARIFADITGDGLPEQITAYFVSDESSEVLENIISSVKVNTGHSFVESDLTFPVPLAPERSINYDKIPFDDMGVRLADFNSDGLLDVLRSYRSKSNPNQIDQGYDESSVYHCCPTDLK